MSTNPKDVLGLQKPPLRLVPPAGILHVAKVMGLGAKKYGPYNWRGKPVRYTIYLEAAMRHILSALDGEEIDPESGQPHAAHAAACMLILLDSRATGNLVDDRPPPGAAARLIGEMTERQPAPVESAIDQESGRPYHEECRPPTATEIVERLHRAPLVEFLPATGGEDATDPCGRPDCEQYRVDIGDGPKLALRKHEERMSEKFRRDFN